MLLLPRPPGRFRLAGGASEASTGNAFDSARVGGRGKFVKPAPARDQDARPCAARVLRSRQSDKPVADRQQG